jgi:hypothetical protein
VQTETVDGEVIDSTLWDLEPGLAEKLPAQYEAFVSARTGFLFHHLLV